MRRGKFEYLILPSKADLFATLAPNDLILIYIGMTLTDRIIIKR